MEIAGYSGRGGEEPDTSLAQRIEIPPEFVERVRAVVAPGATVLVTDAQVTAATTGPQLDVINSEPPEE